MTRRKRILVVEQSADLATLLRRLLTRQGYQVCCSRAVPEALRLARENHFDLLIADTHLPPADRRQLLDWLQSCDGGPPAFVLLTEFDPPHVPPALRNLALATVPKPVDPRQLLAQVARVASPAVRGIPAGARQPVSKSS